MKRTVPQKTRHRADVRANLFVIVLDTVRAMETVPLEEALTPTMATLAKEGMEFRRAYADAPWSLPSHASLFTGTNPSTHRTNGRNPRLDSELPTIAEVFSEAEYETVAVSNNTWVSDEFGFDRGFESFFHGWDTTEIPSIRRESWRGESQEHQHDTRGEKTTNWIKDWIANRDNSRPFFFFTNYIDAHLPYAPPREFVEDELPPGYSYERALDIPQDPRRYDVGETSISDEQFEVLRALYRGEIAYLDANIEAIVTQLRAHGEWENTVLVITSDHGENIGDHGFLGHQYNIYDTLLHVPLIITGGAFSRGESTDRLVQLSDLPPTILDEFGIQAPTARERFQGYSFHPHTKEPSREYCCSEYIAPQPSIDELEHRFGSLPTKLSHYDRSLFAIRTQQHKLIRSSDRSQAMYDIGDDPAETRDIIGRRPTVETTLSGELTNRSSVDGPTASSSSNSISTESKERLRELGYL
jgi:arylsulfatase A-like enzyme